MEPILLYGFPAGSSLGLVMALEWLGLPHRLSRVDMMGPMQQPSYGRINPRHETPVLVTEDGRVLTETMAIAGWLEARDPDRRISFDPASPEADRAHQLAAFINTGFTGAFSPLWVAMEDPSLDENQLAVLREFGHKRVRNRHDRLEEMIGDTPFLVGDRPSIADGILIGVARWLDFHKVGDRSEWPKLDAVRRRIEADPAYAYALAIEEGETPAGSGACLGQVPLDEVIERFGTPA